MPKQIDRIEIAKDLGKERYEVVYRRNYTAKEKASEESILAPYLKIKGIKIIEDNCVVVDKTKKNFGKLIQELTQCNISKVYIANNNTLQPIELSLLQFYGELYGTEIVILTEDSVEGNEWLKFELSIIDIRKYTSNK